jgi:esterase/lipase superfamily enzyme
LTHVTAPRVTLKSRASLTVEKNASFFPEISMEFNYVVTARLVRGGAFRPQPGPVRFLKVPDASSTFTPAEVVASPKAWANEIIALANGDENPNSISPTGDVLIYVHGYNNDPPIVLQRLRQLRADLRAEGWRGVVIAFDWPSDNQVLNYLEDRSDAAAVAIELVDRGVALIAEGQAAGCKTNLHLLAHSTGAFVVMEAFAQAEKRGDLFKSDWRMGQVAFIAGDVAQASLSLAESWSQPMFKRIMRLTNYSNPYDAVLALKRQASGRGTAGRPGRPSTGR